MQPLELTYLTNHEAIIKPFNQRRDTVLCSGFKNFGKTRHNHVKIEEFGQVPITAVENVSKLKWTVNFFVKTGEIARRFAAGSHS